MNPRVLIRADGGHNVGLGHLTRCLALAEALRARKCDVDLVTRTTRPELLTKIQDAGCAIIPLSQVTTEDEAILALIKHAGGTAANAAVLDSYRITESHQRAVKAAGLRVLALRDLDSAPDAGDLSLNPSDLDAKADPRRLHGPRFALLRPEFAAQARMPRAASKTIGVMMGGSDPGGLTAAAAEALAGFDVQVVAGAAFEGRLPENARVIKDPPNIAEVMAGWGLAVTAAGSTCWELACLGVPAILLAAADNQEPIAAGLDKRGVGVSLGAAKPFPAAKLKSAVAGLLADADRRKKMELAGRALVDGHGAGRVADALLAIIPK